MTFMQHMVDIYFMDVFTVGIFRLDVTTVDFLHFVWGIAEAKCIVATAVCVSVPRATAVTRMELGEW